VEGLTQHLVQREYQAIADSENIRHGNYASERRKLLLQLEVIEHDSI